MNFGESLAIQTYRFPDKVAIKDDAKDITYKQLNQRVNSLAHGMMDLGLKKGDVICQLQGNSIEHIELLYGIAKAGLIRLPLNPRASKDEFAHIINAFDPAALVFEDDFSEVVAGLRPQLKCSRFIYVGSGALPGTIMYEELATKFSQDEPNLELKENDPYLVQSTSGTTGIPKAALLSQGGMVRRALVRAIDFGNSSNGVFLGVTLLANTASVFFGLSQLYLGGTVILRNKFEPVEALKTMERERVTNVSMVPAMWDRIIQVPDLSEYDLSSLAFIISYGAPLHTQTKEGLLKHISPNLFENYGITETGPITNILPKDQLRKVNCVGVPTMHTRIKIQDLNGKELPVDKEGEIVVQTPYLFVGYLNNPEATAEVFRDGWYYTGDMGKFDEEHYLYIVGRLKDMIISGGYNIYAEEIERTILNIPQVQEVAVIGVPDERWGEAVKAIVVLKPMARLREEEIIDFCRERLGSYKKPQSVEFVNSLPRVGAGKVAKQQLRQKYWAGLERGVH